MTERESQRQYLHSVTVCPNCKSRLIDTDALSFNQYTCPACLRCTFVPNRTNTRFWFDDQKDLPRGYKDPFAPSEREKEDG